MAPTESGAPTAPRADFCVFSVPFWNPTYEEFKAWWDWSLDHGQGTQLVELANPNTLNIAYSDEEFRAILRQAHCCVNDGVGIRMAGNMRGVPTKYNFAGTDLMPRLFQEAHRPIRVFFYGASEESNSLAVEKITARYPRVVASGRINGYVDPVNDALPLIRESGSDVLMCALGQPKQERFMWENLDALNVKLAVTCGGMFDFFSETKPRAPLWMRKASLEWVYRLGIEPRRMFKRYVIGNPQFLLRAYAWKARDLKCAEESLAARSSIEAQS